MFQLFLCEKLSHMKKVILKLLQSSHHIATTLFTRRRRAQTIRITKKFTKMLTPF